MNWSLFKYTPPLMDIVKRAVSPNDCDLIMAWRNSLSARGVSRIGNELNEAEHREWFISRIARTECEPFWIMSVLNEDIGFVRLDHVEGQEDLYTVSIFVATRYQAVGNGKKMLSIVLASAVSDNLALGFRAVIQKSNVSSIALFKQFGFQFKSEIDRDFDEYQVAANEIKINANSF